MRGVDFCRKVHPLSQLQGSDLEKMEISTHSDLMCASLACFPVRSLFLNPLILSG